MQKRLGSSWLLMWEFVLDDRVLSWAGCVSLQTTGLTTSSVAFTGQVTPLHTPITSDNSECSYCSFGWQLLTISPERIRFCQHSRGWVNALLFPLNGNFYKPQGLMDIVTKLNLLLSAVAEGALVSRHLSDGPW